MLQIQTATKLRNLFLSVMLILENGSHVFQRETLTRNGILETEMPDFPDWWDSGTLSVRKLEIRHEF